MIFWVEGRCVCFFFGGGVTNPPLQEIHQNPRCFSIGFSGSASHQLFGCVWCVLGVCVFLGGRGVCCSWVALCVSFLGSVVLVRGVYVVLGWRVCVAHGWRGVCVWFLGSVVCVVGSGVCVPPAPAGTRKNHAQNTYNAPIQNTYHRPKNTHHTLQHHNTPRLNTHTAHHQEQHHTHTHTTAHQEQHTHLPSQRTTHTPRHPRTTHTHTHHATQEQHTTPHHPRTAPHHATKNDTHTTLHQHLPDLPTTWPNTCTWPTLFCSQKILPSRWSTALRPISFDLPHCQQQSIN